MEKLYTNKLFTKRLENLPVYDVNLHLTVLITNYLKSSSNRENTGFPRGSLVDVRIVCRARLALGRVSSKYCFTFFTVIRL